MSKFISGVLFGISFVLIGIACWYHFNEFGGGFLGLGIVLSIISGMVLVVESIDY
jgi:hypothetical protein